MGAPQAPPGYRRVKVPTLRAPEWDRAAGFSAVPVVVNLLREFSGGFHSLPMSFQRQSRKTRSPFLVPASSDPSLPRTFLFAFRHSTKEYAPGMPSRSRVGRQATG
jgi:hypothetical protein